MTIQKTIAGMVFFGFCAVFSIQAQDMEKPWEKYGLSKTEWQMIQDNKIPMKKVEELLKTGISITEYLEKPWDRLHISEHAYINKRRSGLSAYDIELEMTSSRGTWKSDNKGTLRSELSSTYGNKDLLLSFALPGYQQFRMKRTWRGRIMASLAIGSVVGSAIWSVSNRTPEVLPIFVILFPDMVWSAFDFKLSKDPNEE
jgi:hypothetical protein